MGFDEKLPPNQEVRTVSPPAPALPSPPAAAPGPSSQPLPSQPSSDPTLALLMSMMFSFQSEMKSLRSDLLGSVSTMVAEAVAAQLPQVLVLMLRSGPSCNYHTFVDIVCGIFYGHFTFVALYRCTMFLASLLHQTLPNLAPPMMPPPSALPMTGEPAGVPQPGWSGLHRSQVLVVTHLGKNFCCNFLVY